MIKELTDKYIKDAEDAVSKQDCPPPIYKFVGENYRKINGYDPEWYGVLKSLRAELALRGYKKQDRRQSKEFISIFDYEYWYPVELDLPVLQYSGEEAWAFLAKLDPRHSSENAL